MTKKPETVRSDEIFENDMDGLVYKTGIYKNGKQDGLWEYFDLNGFLNETIEFQ